MRTALAFVVVALIACGSDDNGCPDGGSLIGVEGVEQWCAVPDGHGGWIKHGPYRKWEDSRGYLDSQGQYCGGTICGHWIRWHDRGVKSRDSYFTDEGEPCGTWMDYDSEGNVVSEEDRGDC